MANAGRFALPPSILEIEMLLLHHANVLDGAFSVRLLDLEFSTNHGCPAPPTLLLVGLVGTHVVDYLQGLEEWIRTTGLSVPNAALCQAELHPDVGKRLWMGFTLVA
jgi:hypothetical protein